MNREIPIGSTTESDKIQRSFTGDDVKELWKELEDGIEMPEILTGLEDVDLLPKMMFDFQRPNSKILKEFGW